MINMYDGVVAGKRPCRPAALRLIALPQIRCKKIPQELRISETTFIVVRTRNAIAQKYDPCWCAPTMLAHEVSVRRRWYALTQLQETATSGTPERYLIILIHETTTAVSQPVAPVWAGMADCVSEDPEQTDGLTQRQLLLAPAHALE